MCLSDRHPALPLMSDDTFYCVSLSTSSVSSASYSLSWLPTWTAASEASSVMRGDWPYLKFPRTVSFASKLLLLRAETARIMCDMQRVAYVAVQQLLDLEHSYHQRDPNIIAPTPALEFEPLDNYASREQPAAGQRPGRFAALGQVDMPRMPEPDHDHVAHVVPFDVTTSYSASVLASADAAVGHGDSHLAPSRDHTTPTSGELTNPLCAANESRDLVEASSAAQGTGPRSASSSRDLVASSSDVTNARHPSITSRFTTLHDDMILLRRLGPSALHHGNVYLVFELGRERLLDDLMAQLNVKAACLWKPLKVRMAGETGEDGLDRGGVQKEIVARAVGMLFEEERGLFETDDVSLLCWFKENANEKTLRLAGEVRKYA